MSKPVFVLNGANSEPARHARAAHLWHHHAGRDRGDVPRAGRAARPRARVPAIEQRGYSGADSIQEAIDAASGIVINPAAHSFTSIALLDALKVFRWPIVEVHISNIHRREPHYHRSYVSYAATGVIAGLGAHGYVLALDAISQMLRQGEPAR